jgi:hypothetical protein
MKKVAILFFGLVAAVMSPTVASAVSMVTVDWNPSNPLLVGLNAEATFTIVDATHLDVLLTNTSTAQPLILAGCPNGTTCPSGNNVNQLLTGLGFDLPGALTIAGGSVLIGTGSISQNFDPNGSAPPISLSGGADVSVEWGFANGVTFTSQLFPALGPGDETLANYLAALSSQTTPFHVIDGTDPNLDGTDGLDGPQAGLVANPNLYDLGGVGAIRNSALIHLTLANGTLLNLDSFDTHTVRFEFGSSLIYGTPADGNVPEPATLVLLGSGLAGLAIWKRRKMA